MNETLTGYFNTEDPTQIIAMVVLIFLAGLLIAAVISGIRGRIIERVKKCSTKYCELLKINEKYKFSKIPNRIRLRRRYTTLQKYRQRNFEQELFGELRDKREKYAALIDKAEMNRYDYLAYCDEVDTISDTEWQVIKNSKVPRRLFLVFEDKYFQIEKLCPEIDFSIDMSMEYTSPAGRKHYEDEVNFSYDEIKKAYGDMLQRIEEQNCESERRKLERSKMTPSLRYEVLKRDKFRCQICGASQSDGVKLHVDHIMPVSKGGKTEMKNLRTLCDMCNLGKSDKIE